MSLVEIFIPIFCSLIGAGVTFYVQCRREKRKEEERQNQEREREQARQAREREREQARQAREEEREKKIVDLEFTQGELADCVAKYMRDNPDSEIFHRVRSNQRITRVTNIKEAVLYVRKDRQDRGVETKRIPIQKPED